MEKPKRDNGKRRMPRWEYTRPGFYFITLAVEGRKPVFGRVVGSSKIPRGQEGCPRMEYSELGYRVVNEIENGMVGTQWEGKVEVACRQVMPDHIHCLYHVKEQLPKHLGHFINGFHVGCRRIARELGITDSGRIFEEGYNDGVVIKHGQLDGYFVYIRDNLRRLVLKREYPNLFRKVWSKELLPGQKFDLIGNMFLLDWPYKLPVRISRFATDGQGNYLQPKRLKTDAEIEESLKPFLSEGERGAVLVTPCISPAEQTVVQKAYERGIRVIMLSLRGFGQYYKPNGSHIDACSRGLLLQLAPWDYDPQRKYTKPLCEALNEMARRLAEGPLAG